MSYKGHWFSELWGFGVTGTKHLSHALGSSQGRPCPLVGNDSVMPALIPCDLISAVLCGRASSGPVVGEHSAKIGARPPLLPDDLAVPPQDLGGHSQPNPIDAWGLLRSLCLTREKWKTVPSRKIGWGWGL